MANELVSAKSGVLTASGDAPGLPSLITRAGGDVERRYLEFFAAQIRNRNTRGAYLRADRDFLDWVEKDRVRQHRGCAVQNQVEDVDGPHQRPAREHLELFPQVGLGREGRQPEKQGKRYESTVGYAVKPLHDSLLVVEHQSDALAFVPHHACRQHRRVFDIE